MASIGLRQVILEQLPHYVGKLRWLFRDAYRLFPGRIRSVMALDAIGVLAGGLWLAGLLIFVDALESKGQASRWPWLPDLTALPTLVVVAGFMVLGLLSAACLYSAQWRVARICIDYQKSTANRILRIVSDPNYFGWQTIFPEPPRQQVLRFTGVSLQLTGMSLRRLLRGALPLATLVVALGALLITNPWLSLLLIPIGLAYLAPLYVANRRAARAHIDSVALTPKIRGKFVAVITRLLNQRDGRSALRSQAERVVASNDFDRSLELVFRKRLADSMVRFINTLFTVACLVALFAYFFSRGDGRWSELLLYLVALRFAIGGLGGVTSSLVGLSRFLPEYEKLSHFLEASETIATQRAARNLSTKLDPKTRLRTGDRGQSIGDDGVLWVIAPPPVGAVDRERILLLLERRLRPAIDLSPSRLESAVRCLRPAELDPKQVPSMPGTLQIVFDGFPKRLARSQWQHWQERIAAVLVYDGSELKGGGDIDWYLAHLDDIGRWVRSSPVASGGDELEELL